MTYTLNADGDYLAILKDSNHESGYDLEYLGLERPGRTDFDYDAKEVLQSKSLDRVVMCKNLIKDTKEFLDVIDMIRSGEIHPDELPEYFP